MLQRQFEHLQRKSDREASFPLRRVAVKNAQRYSISFSFLLLFQPFVRRKVQRGRSGRGRASPAAGALASYQDEEPRVQRVHERRKKKRTGAMSAHFPPQQQQQDQQHHHHHQQHTFQRETVVTKQEEEEEEEEVELLLTHFIFRRRLRIIFHTRADAQTNTHTQERVTHHDQALTCHDWQVAGGPPPSPSPSRPNQSAAGGDGIVGTATIGDDSAWVY